MKSISIHGIDDPVYRLIKARAKSEGQSINQTVKFLLEQSLGVATKSSEPYRKEFEEFCGSWTAEEATKFNAAVEDLGRIDPEDWK